MTPEPAWMGWAGVGLVAAALILLYWCSWRYAKAVGRHEGRMAERERWLDRQRSRQMRAPYDGPVIASKTSGPPPGWYTEAPKRPARRVVTTAADIAPVIVPVGAATIPITPRPSPYPDGTVPLRKLTDTGEMAAITNERIHLMRADQAAWLARYRQEFAR